LSSVNSMQSCSFHFQLDAWHDGELSGGQRREMEDHVAGCRVCAGRLAAMRRISELFASARVSASSAVLKPDEAAAIHAAVDAVTIKRHLDGAFVRAAGALATLAASLLIVSCVWLHEMPSAARGPAKQVVAYEPMLPWERTAVTLQSEAPPAALAETRLADAADWMVNSLSPGQVMSRKMP